MISVRASLRFLRRTMNRKLNGLLSVELAISPLVILFEIVLLLAFVMVIFYGIQSLFFQLIILNGAREAAINPDVFYVQQKIYDVVANLLPIEQSGILLFEISDIYINEFDGDYASVHATYRVLLPGAQLYESLGGNRADLIVEAPAKFSFLREY